MMRIFIMILFVASPLLGVSTQPVSLDSGGKLSDQYIPDPNSPAVLKSVFPF
jgi:hypothetical protein